ncbi:MAG: hypothetical protein ACYDAZ_04935 [Thermoplasmataceae archaeon]
METPAETLVEQSEALNDLYLSSDRNDLMKFYNSFSSAHDLVRWMQERPKGESNIVYVKGENHNVAVVIPTVSISREFAKGCLEIFKGFDLVFVESGAGNRHFNFSHNCNVGFRYVIGNLSPSWIVYTNDDMYRVDPPSVLEHELAMIRGDPSVILAGFQSHYHSYISRFLSPSRTHSAMAAIVRGSMRTMSRLQYRFAIKYLPVWDHNASISGRLSRAVLQREIASVINTGSFGIFSFDFVKKLSGKVYDETFLTGLEDIDLSIRIAKEKIPYGFIDYRIGDYVGMSSSSGGLRYLKNMANYACLNLKHPKESVTGIKMNPP